MHSCWLYLGFQDIKLRYSRSILGPWWLTLSTTIFIAALTLLWVKILKVEVESYLPYFAIGQIFWVWFSGQISESSAGFTQFEGLVKQIKLPFPVYILRIIFRNSIILIHNFLVIVAILLFFPPKNLLAIFLLVPAFILVLISTFSISLMLSMLCTRYRDVTQIVSSLMQLLFFFTPIMWFVDSLGSNSWLAKLNPLYHIITLIRLPLLGMFPDAMNWICVFSISVLLFLMSLYCLGKYSKKIAYWI